MTHDHLTYTPFALPLVASAAITLGLGLYTLLGRRIAGAGTFGLVMFGVVEWSLAYALVLSGVDLETKTFWYQFEYYQSMYQLGQYDKIVALADKTLASMKGENMEESRYWRGRALAGLGRTDEAQAEFHKALEYNPLYAPAREALGG